MIPMGEHNVRACKVRQKGLSVFVFTWLLKFIGLASGLAFQRMKATAAAVEKFFRENLASK